MRLFLLRHAEAEDHATTDAARELTALGREQARTVGAFCQRQALRPEIILCSPYRRTVQTAEAVADALGQTALEVPFLASGMHAETALDELRACGRFGSVLLVGHQPDLGELCAALLGLSNDGVLAVEKASLIALEVDQLARRKARLEFFLPVKLMGA